MHKNIEDRRITEKFAKILKVFFFSQKALKKQFQVQNQGIDSENERADNKYDENEKNYGNEKIAIMAKLKTHFDVSKDNFFSYVEKWMKGEENKVYLTDLKF